jgi:hypothetical protein
MTLNEFTATPASDAVVPVRRDIRMNRHRTPAVVT